MSSRIDPAMEIRINNYFFSNNLEKKINKVQFALFGKNSLHLVHSLLVVAYALAVL